MTSDWPALLRIAVDLSRSLAADDRYQRLLEVVRSAIPCDATALLSLRDGALVPLATYGLSPQVLGMRFPVREHPRLAAIVASDRPVRFPADSPLPDPFDGLVDGTPDALHDVHDCMGCPLIVDDRVIGALTADALKADAFDALDDSFLAGLGALAGAALHTSRLVDTIAALAEKRGMVVRELTREAAEHHSSHLIGVSAAMDRVRKEIETVGRSDLAVLIQGETGTGKELAAHAVHAASARRTAPLIYVNCAALPDTVVESELFGHVRGAFTGATTDRAGKFEVADGGTLFLDEIGELPLAVQPKLLRALQQGEIQRVGSDAAIRVDVRIVAATNRDLEREVAAGRFRADLYHRLNVYPIAMPPLRDRREDIGVLAGFLLDRYRARLGAGSVILGRDATAALRDADWPGNVRELEHVLARGALRAAARARDGGPVLVELGDLDLATGTAPPPAADTALAARDVSLRDAVDELKRSLITRTLDHTAGNWAEAARRLGMNRSNLHHMAKRLGIRSG